MTRDQLPGFELPDEPGVYFFKSRGAILYIGKATSLSDRVASYFSKDLAETRNPGIVKMVAEADQVGHEVTGSVLEALILEAALIKRHQPPYNIDQKDNKSFNYLVITKEKYPRVLVVRGRELFQKWLKKDIKSLFGPFPQGGSLHVALKLIRKIFPFRDRCTPCQSEAVALRSCKPCFNAQIGLCPGVCSGKMSAAEYAHTVKNLQQLFGGNMKGLKRQLARDMKSASDTEHYELADAIRRQLFALEHIRDVALIKGDRTSTGGGIRIEAYDIAHTGGSETVGVMAVVNGDEVDKAEYRKFKINSVSNDDTHALAEMLERRLTHSEWTFPKLFVIDGGVGQVNTIRKVLERAGVSIPVVGVVKDEFHRPVRLIGPDNMIQAYEKHILLANSEAHRFGISWHRKRLAKRLFES